MIHDELVNKRPPQFGLRSHLDDFELYMLKLGDRTPEGAALPAIPDSEIQDKLSGDHRTDGTDKAFLLKFHHEFDKSASLVSETVLLRNPTVGKK